MAKPKPLDSFRVRDEEGKIWASDFDLENAINFLKNKLNNIGFLERGYSLYPGDWFYYQVDKNGKKLKNIKKGDQVLILKKESTEQIADKQGKVKEIKRNFQEHLPMFRVLIPEFKNSVTKDGSWLLYEYEIEKID